MSQKLSNMSRSDLGLLNLFFLGMDTSFEVALMTWKHLLSSCRTEHSLSHIDIAKPGCSIHTWSQTPCLRRNLPTSAQVVQIYPLFSSSHFIKVSLFGHTTPYSAGVPISSTCYDVLRQCRSSDRTKLKLLADRQSPAEQSAHDLGAVSRRWAQTKDCAFLCERTHTEKQG